MRTDSTITPQPTTEFERVRYGLLTPEGELFACGFTDHSYLVGQLEHAGILDPKSPYEYDGCVHISEFDFDLARDYPDCRKVTQKQLDVMFDYMLAHGQRFPFDSLEVIDAKQSSTSKTRALRPVFQGAGA